MSQPNDCATESQDDLPEHGRLTLLLDPVHYAALRRLSASVHLKDQQVLRHLIRIADRFMQGDDSPFIDRLEGIFPQRKVG